MQKVLRITAQQSAENPPSPLSQLAKQGSLQLRYPKTKTKFEENTSKGNEFDLAHFSDHMSSGWVVLFASLPRAHRNGRHSVDIVLSVCR